MLTDVCWQTVAKLWSGRTNARSAKRESAVLIIIIIIIIKTDMYSAIKS